MMASYSLLFVDHKGGRYELIKLADALSFLQGTLFMIRQTLNGS